MDEITRIAHRLQEADGVVAVALGGSRARGTHRPDSDVDLGLYYRAPLDTEALRRLAAELSGDTVEVTEPGGWGPWVNGGAWLTVEGTPVDWIYRDLDHVRRVWQQCRDGHVETSLQPGHPYGFSSHTYAGEVALGRVLTDPTGELTALRDDIRSGYPRPLRNAVVGQARWEAPFTLSVARKGVPRGDAFHVAGCLYRAVGLLVHALHSDAGAWVLNEKDAVRSAGALPAAPAGFTARAHTLFGTLGPAPDRLTAALDDADRLAADVLNALPAE
ncbi:nucleotidyltransferase domain-containing protein [Streptomyces cellulosae]|uniref:nucleotidyltransferase domain-containing protein n=2 Tax=Streptomyces TaxID=1883 RepID=UPI002257E67D|nr:nucleotidyltransferase domain-containing protein [Streptomyces cellulosae]MDX3414386.1 nucleotidyltransferase domain-containing protein [Streptomyces sp. MD20-1-1]WSB52379.1 nucleotidyltransferase domain-containing protein [Streptomyces cellulosae]WSB82435.1 nucleotidyltransferase domain-containing protein [Streptomyces cellulosae]WTB67404.1 nucleotidyltransferase domain-containing protein [Streptomyces cellulosae]